MTWVSFKEPVYIWRKHYVEEILTLEEAFDFLEKWPKERRNLAYDTLLRAFRETYAGCFPVESARQNFSRFLTQNDMLADIAEMLSFSSASHDEGLKE